MQPAKRATAVFDLRLSPAPRALNIFNDGFLGFRCAPPQADMPAPASRVNEEMFG